MPLDERRGTPTNRVGFYHILQQNVLLQYFYEDAVAANQHFPQASLSLVVMTFPLLPVSFRVWVTRFCITLNLNAHQTGQLHYFHAGRERMASKMYRPPV